MKRLFSALSLLILLVCSAPAWAQSELERHLGPLARAVELGQDGDWTLTAGKSWFIMSNTTNPDAIRYHFVTLKNTPQNYTLSTQLAVRAAEGSLADAGLIFNFREGPRYLAVVIGSDNTASVLIRDDEGLNSESSETVQARGDGTDVLRIIVRGGNARMELNGEKLFEVNGSGFAPELGLIALGAGSFGFTDVSLEVDADAAPQLPETSQENPPELPDLGGEAPPELPGGDENGPPPVPESGNEPPPIPEGEDGPPALPGDDGPPPLPGGDGPPPLPEGGDGPPPLPEDNADGPPPLPEQNQQAGDRRLEQIYFAVIMGIYFHELGHAIIGETKLPSTGPEEDVADSFSAHLLASSYKEAPAYNKEFVHGITRYSALMWYHLSRGNQQSNTLADWQGEHSPNIRRFRNWFCILYGSDPTAFNGLAQRVDFNPEQRARCLSDYQRQFDAWEELLALKGRNLGPGLEGAYSKDEPGGKAILTFEPATTPFGKEIEQMLQTDPTIRGVTEIIGAYFVFPRDLRVTFKNCGVENAWYDPRQGTVTMCYEAIKYFSHAVKAGEGISAQ